jgi:hypothetical protein
VTPSVIHHQGDNHENFQKRWDRARLLVPSFLPAEPLGFEPTGGE